MVRLEYVTVRVIPQGWLSAVGIVQHIHRRVATSGLRESARLSLEGEYRRDAPFPSLDQAHGERWWWSVYVDDEEISEVVPYAVAMEVKGTMSEHHQDLTRALAECRIPTSASKTVERQLTSVRKGLEVDGVAGTARPPCQKALGAHSRDCAHP